MGNYKKNVREINKAKNLFIKWLKDKDAESLDCDKPEVSEEWDYYCVVSGFVNDVLYTVYFMVWHGDLSIDYSDEYNTYNKLSVYDFLQIIS